MLVLGGILAFSDARAQTQGSTSASSSSKDEYWGTSRTEEKGATTDAVGKRSAGLDERWNAYETGKQSRFTKERIKHSAKMKAILKQEKEMQRKHKRDKKMLKRNRARH